jgi:tetratricopeptide (TPR) repeat protein
LVIAPDRASGEDATAPLLGDGTSAAGFSFDTSKSPFSPELHAQVVEVMNLIYNFEFDRASYKAETIRAGHPSHPLGHFLLAEIYWWQAINNRDRPELVEDFRKHSTAAMASSERLLDRDSRDPVALFFLGGINGRKAILDGLGGRRFESVNTSVRARKYLKLLNRHHPDAVDASFGLGLYDYYAAQLPWFARLLSRFLFGLGGDQEAGIAQLERAAREGLFTRVEARIFLALAYLDSEGRYEEALEILKDLSARYPKNLDFYGMLAYTYRTRFDYANAIQMLEHLVEQGEHEPAFGRQSRQMCAYFLASTYKAAGRFDQAEAILDDLIARPNPDTQWLSASSLLERGRIRDLKGERSAAIADYRQVLKLKNFRGSRDKAKGFISEPYLLSEEERSHHLPGNHAGASSERGPEAGDTGQSALPGNSPGGDAENAHLDP